MQSRQGNGQFVWLQSGEESQKSIPQPIGTGYGNLTLPDDEDSPAEAAKLPLHPSIALGVAGNLGEPVGAAGGRNAAATAGMTVPITAVDEDDPAMTRKDDVG